MHGVPITLILSMWLAPHGAGTPVRSEVSLGDSRLLIDPLLIAEAAEVWSVIATDDNAVWPGWNAADTPLLLYLPGRQDVLINHPRPPDGFVPYSGSVRFPGGRIMLRNGETILPWDGQNTSREVEGVRTLVVADTLSNRMLDLKAMIEDSRPVRERIADLTYERSAGDPYDTLGLIAHEAFHVYQHRQAPGKGANELALRTYPVLSVRNNVGFALEGAALADALRANGPESLRAAVVSWLAIRKDRRSHLSGEAIEYEDGTEFNEGLAKYIEYRLFNVLEGREAGPAMKWVQGFNGYEDLSAVRERLIDQMVEHMRGEANVNSDPYGASPLRMRFYYSGMAISALLDKLAPDWHSRIFEPDSTLTQLVVDAVRASDSELAEGLLAAKAAAGYQALVESKKLLELAGKQRISQMLADISESSGGSVTIDYSALGKPQIRMAFTPFGITAVDDDRTIYRLVPLKVRLGDGYSFAKTEATPVLHDKKLRCFKFAMPELLSREQLARALGEERLPEKSVQALSLELPAATINAKRAHVTWKTGNLTVALLPAED